MLFKTLSAIFLALLALAPAGCATLAEWQAMQDSWDNPGGKTAEHPTLFGNDSSNADSSGRSPGTSSRSSRFSATGDYGRGDEDYQRPARSSELFLGMAMRDVQMSWGSPHSVETAGDPSYGNQRWIYKRGFSRLGGETKIVYFEEGRVVGWETN